MVKSLPYLTHLDSLSAILKAFRLTVPSAIYTATSKKFGAKGLAALEDAEYKEIIQRPNSYVFAKDAYFGHTIGSWFAGDSSPRKDLIMQGPPDRSNVTAIQSDTHKKVTKGIKKTSKPAKPSLF